MSGRVDRILAEEEPLWIKIVTCLRAQGVTAAVESVALTFPPELRGSGVATLPAYVTVKFQGEEVQDRNLFVKLLPTNRVHLGCARRMGLMEKEASFFNSFLPKMREFCGRFEGCEDLLNFFPKSVFADDDCLVLENLVLNEGFVMLNREDRQGFETAKKVLTNLATLHAVSYAYIREDYSDNVEEFREDWGLICREAFLRADLPMTNTMFEGALKQALYILQQNFVAGADIAIGQLSEFLDDEVGQGRLKQLILDLLKPDVQGKVQVVNHGDCWNNNMLFKINPENGEPKDNILLDFQVTRLGSPCLDLGYYLFLSVDPRVRRDHFQELLQHYFDDFQNVLEKLLGLQCPITFEEFVADYKRKFQVGLFMAMTVMGALGGVTEVDMEGLPHDGETVRRALGTAMRGWVDSHPIESTELAKEIVSMLNERDELMN